MILDDFDSDPDAIINTNLTVEKINDFPKIGVSWFSKRLFDKYIEILNPKKIGEIASGNGKSPVYEIDYKGVKIALFMAKVGAPICVMGYEELLVMGLEKLVLFGTCGVLDKEIEDCSIIIPTSAIRDEGTSYHYMSASEEIVVNEKYVELFEEVLNEHNYSHVKGKVWTTDAPYRETRDKMKKRKEQGCVCVDMECASMAAVAKFRNKDLFQFFYAADNLDSTNWDVRSLGKDIKLDEKEKMVLLALELAKRISEQDEKV